jgi:hypothetical protein
MVLFRLFDLAQIYGLEWPGWETIRGKWYGYAHFISMWHRSDGYSGAEQTV